MSRGIQEGFCACGCGQPTRRYGSRVCKWVGKHYMKAKRGQNAGYTVEDRGHETPCWIWQGGRQEQGYGRISVDRRNVPAHRHFYELHVGPVPAGLQLDHLCRVPSCCNPEHVEPVTAAENIRRSTRTILTVEIAGEIRRTVEAAAGDNDGRVPNGLYAELAERYGVKKGTVRAIRKGAIWRDVV